jgi:hypothetical protein
MKEDAKSSPEGMIAACIKRVEKEKGKFIMGGVTIGKICTEQKVI